MEGTLPRTLAPFEFSLSSAGYLSNALFLCNFSEYHHSAETRFPELHFCHRHRLYGSNFNHCDVIDSKCPYFCEINAK